MQNDVGCFPLDFLQWFGRYYVWKIAWLFRLRDFNTYLRENGDKIAAD